MKENFLCHLCSQPMAKYFFQIEFVLHKWLKLLQGLWNIKSFELFKIVVRDTLCALNLQMLGIKDCWLGWDYFSWPWNSCSLWEERNLSWTLVSHIHWFIISSA